jgi:hypothetical protein
MKKKTPTQKYIDKAVKQAVETCSKGTAITNCSMVGVKFDAKAVDAIETIADGLVENAKALGILARVLNGSNVQIDSMIRIEGDA